jgi:hypothetical protein
VIGEVGVSTSSRAAGKNSRSTRESGDFLVATAPDGTCEGGTCAGAPERGGILLVIRAAAFGHHTGAGTISSKPSAAGIMAASNCRTFPNEGTPNFSAASALARKQIEAVTSTPVVARSHFFTFTPSY